jgi:hypothetical protein
MASAAALTEASSTLSLKWFQLFHPIGGSAASASFCANAEDGETRNSSANKKQINRIIEDRIVRNPLIRIDPNLEPRGQYLIHPTTGWA